VILSEPIENRKSHGIIRQSQTPAKALKADPASGAGDMIPAPPRSPRPAIGAGFIDGKLREWSTKLFMVPLENERERPELRPMTARGICRRVPSTSKAKFKGRGSGQGG